MNHKVVEHHRCSTKRQLMVMNAKNRTLKMHFLRGCAQNIISEADLVEKFEEQIIGFGGFQEWPPRSPDLTPMDFFLWRCIKQQVYATRPPTLKYSETSSNGHPYIAANFSWHGFFGP
ncbi:hypothetical protein AVEN_181844-1 [Araneus ventricosus]|uniref:Uncharacterized protein n=1 Tax=Araneus ventricosus TaxID=182803 RepID=A0A4Y2EWI9_ARAVE|nr:hypothetical protein AVEN_181844-1 [Araneus ventricosus]